jgi:hypothetical protein
MTDRFGSVNNTIYQRTGFLASRIRYRYFLRVSSTAARTLSSGGIRPSAIKRSTSARILASNSDRVSFFGLMVRQFTATGLDSVSVSGSAFVSINGSSKIASPNIRSSV